MNTSWIIRSRRARVFPALAVVAAWGTMALIETGKSYSAAQADGGHPQFLRLLLFNLPWWAIWAALTFLVVVVTRRLPLDDARRTTAAIPAHLVVGASVALLHLLLSSFVYTEFFGARVQAPSGDELFRRWTNAFFVSNLTTYAMIVAAAYAVQFAQRYKASALRAAEASAQAERLERRVTEARLSALQRELNPHFLFNALNAVSGLVRRQENDRAVQMLARVGDLLRETLERGDAVESTIEAEMSLLGHYLDIEQTRFGSRLRVGIDVRADTRDALLPTFVLQPLVENAIRHGVARTNSGGFVSIEAFRENGILHVLVRNTGAPPAPADHSGSGQGVGLSNTRARLAELYNAQAGVDFSIDADGEATTRLWAPFHTVPVI
jgi:two-component system, LytTR family, sensor kinase